MARHDFQKFDTRNNMGHPANMTLAPIECSELGHTRVKLLVVDDDHDVRGVADIRMPNMSGVELAEEAVHRPYRRDRRREYGP